MKQATTQETPYGGRQGEIPNDTQRERFEEKAGAFAGVVFVLSGTLVLSLFAWFLLANLSGLRRFTTWPAIAVYQVAPAAVAVLLFASLRLKPVARLRLLVTGVSLVASVYVIELFLVLSGAIQTTVFASLDDHAQLQPMMARVARSPRKAQFVAALTKEYGHSIDIRSPAEVIDDFRKKGIDAIPIVTATNQLFTKHPDGTLTSTVAIEGREVVPLGSVSGAVTLLCNEDGEWISYRSDSRGFNNPDDVWRAGRIDIAALGDSFAQGYCVPPGAGFVDLIRQRDSATVNLGMAGDAPLMMLATLTEYLTPVAPRTVLWFYYEGNDLIDLQTERKNALLMNYLRDGFLQADLTRQRDIDRAITAEMPRLAAIAAEDARRRSRNSMVPGSIATAKLTAVRNRLTPLVGTDPDAMATATDFDQDNMKVFDDIMRTAKARVDAWNGQLYFVYLPEWTRYTRYRSRGMAKRGAVLELVRRLGISVIDIDPVFRAHGDPLSLFPFREVGHYTTSGHRLVAEEVVRHLPRQQDR